MKDGVTLGVISLEPYKDTTGVTKQTSYMKVVDGDVVKPIVNDLVGKKIDSLTALNKLAESAKGDYKITFPKTTKKSITELFSELISKE